MATASKHGRFVWYDLMTRDPNAAVEFYTKLVGWSTEKWDGPEEYTMWTNRDEPLGGVMDLPDHAVAAGAPPHWVAYVQVDDVDAVAKKGKKLGGKVLVPPTDIPGTGRFSMLADPLGAVFAAYQQSGDGPDLDGQPKAGQFSWHELMTSDFRAAFDFYHGLFGWRKTEGMDMGGGWIYQMYGLGDVVLGGMFDKTPDMPGPPSWLYYIEVENTLEAAAKVTDLGGKVLNGPMDVPGGTIVQCLDPQGAAFAMHAANKE